MKKILTLFTLLILSHASFCQQLNNSQIWHLTIADSTTKKGIERATVEIGSSEIFSTDNYGRLYVRKNVIGRNDTIKISCIGYMALLLPLSTLRSFPDTIQLSKSIMELRAVSIVCKPTMVTMNPLKTKYKMEMPGYPNHEFAQYIPNDNRISGTIAAVDFELNDLKHGIEQPFNVEILSRDRNSIFPHTALIKDSIIVYNPEKKMHVMVDVSKYNIPIPENGIFVVFETLSESHYPRVPSMSYGQYSYKAPAVNIYLVKKNKVDGECCDPEPPHLTGYYCMLRDERKKWEDFIITEQWIIYAQGITFAIGATIKQTPADL